MRLFQGVEQNHLAGLVWFNEKASKDWEPQDDPAALSAFRSSLRNISTLHRQRVHRPQARSSKDGPAR